MSLNHLCVYPIHHINLVALNLCCPCKNFSRYFKIFFLLSPAFLKKSGGTLFLVFRGAWRVVRGTWRVVRGSEFLVGTLSP